MKKKLTVNTLALGNLKQRRKQYTIMIIGIILAMVFSSSIVLFMFSAVETNREYNCKRFGKQACALFSENITDSDWQDAVDKGFLNGYGYMHNIGYAYVDENDKHLGCAVTWMDDKAEELYYLTLLEGRKPTVENEIAIEKSSLKRLGYKEAGIGDKISLNLDVENVENFGKTVKKEYTIVGIYDDRKTTIEQRYYNGSAALMNYDAYTPAIYVAQGTPVETGGKELRLALIETNDKYGTYFCEKEQEKYYNDFAYFGYFLDKGVIEGSFEINQMTGAGHTSNDASLDDLFNGGDYMGIVIAVLVFASCVSIINSFNTNLKERKKQIGFLRAVGTTKRQIINIFGREAFIISLIATPISVAISYAIVKFTLTIIGGKCLMAKSIWSLVASAIVNIIVVMLAALIPLFIASRVTPMQAIRNVDTNRKAHTKKIKSKHSFKPAQHLANRITKFYKGSTVAVSVLLTVTICFSCIAVSFITYSSNDVYVHPHDYALNGAKMDGFDGINHEKTIGLTELDRQDIASKSYVEKTFGEKDLNCSIVIDELSDFYKIMDYTVFDDGSSNSNAEFKSLMQNGKPSEEYNSYKKDLQITKEQIRTEIFAYEKSEIDVLQKVLTDGKIDYNKLTSGEEIILVAPQKAELVCKISNKSVAITHRFDNRIGKYSSDYDSVLTAECPYNVGDEIELVIGTYSYDEKNDEEVVSSVERKKVKVGAIVSPNKLGYYVNGLSPQDFSIMTTIEGLNNFQKNVPYTNLSFDVNEEVDDELDLQITEEMSDYTEKYDTGLTSDYSFIQIQKTERQLMLVGIIAIVIIGFAVCISIINNSISAQIRENKRVIGTLRAVGADQKELSKAYIYQMLSMFGWGTGLGYGLFLLILGIVKIGTLKTGGNFEFIFNPWFTVAMTVFAFALCSINVFSKVKKEMKNSIVENIREL
ncbi:MAG: ABC transporter permease [Ruminococcus sp.]